LTYARNNQVFEEKQIKGFNGKNRKEKTFRKKILKPLEIVKVFEDSNPLSPEEKELIESMPGVSWKPRKKYISFKFSRKPEDWESMGFISQYHYAGWLYFSQLTNEHFTGYEVDILHKKSSCELSDNY